MGCFDSTCALTRLPIHAGDEIVYVEYKSPYGELTDGGMNTYDFLQHTFAAAKGMPEYEKKFLEDSYKRLGEQYPNVYVDVPKAIAEDIQQRNDKIRSVILIVHGEYNDYGGIGEEWHGETVYPNEEIRMDHSDRYFFIHKEVWDAYRGKDDYETLYNLNHAAFIARIQLFSHSVLLGEQHSGGDFIEARRKIQEIGDALLPNLACTEIAGWDEEGEENEDGE